MDAKHLLRHLLATLAFRTRHALREAPAGFDDFEAGLGARTPCQILNHINAILYTTELRCRGQKPDMPEELPWHEALETFHLSLARLDQAIEESDLSDEDTLRLYQGPWLDAVTHIGQLALLRRLYGSPVVGVNYYRADIAVGKVGRQQPV